MLGVPVGELKLPEVAVHCTSSPGSNPVAPKLPVPLSATLDGPVRPAPVGPDAEFPAQRARTISVEPTADCVPKWHPAPPAPVIGGPVVSLA